MQTTISKINKPGRFGTAAVLHRLCNPIANQNGSVLVLTLMIMVIMAIIGISSTDTVVTENFIMRNVGIHRENVNLVESVLMEGLQAFMQLDDSNAANFDPATSNIDWINDRNDAWTTGTWYDRNDVSTQLVAGNSDNTNANLETLNNRGEANVVLRTALVGWAPVTFGQGGSSSLVVTGGAVWHAGRVLGEYVSADAGGNDNGNGFLRMELGVRRQW
jgi:Tfp pilus assembly protein PilX